MLLFEIASFNFIDVEMNDLDSVVAETSPLEVPFVALSQCLRCRESHASGRLPSQLGAILSDDKRYARHAGVRYLKKKTFLGWSVLGCECLCLPACSLSFVTAVLAEHQRGATSQGLNFLKATIVPPKAFHTNNTIPRRASNWASFR